MRESLLEWLRCPSGCEQGLGLYRDRADDGEVMSGALCCPGCECVYPIEDGIPRLLPKGLSEQSGLPSSPNPSASKGEGSSLRQNLSGSPLPSPVRAVKSLDPYGGEGIRDEGER